MSWIKRYLDRSQNILDLGCGPCWVTSILRNEGFNVTPVDVEDLSIMEGIEPIVYDGKELPFGDNEFDITLLLTVLHHVREPVSLLREVKRVSNDVVIIEDVHSNAVMKQIIKFLDSAANLEFRGPPHNNHTDNEWRSIFQKEGFSIVDHRSHRRAGLFRQVVYHIKRT